MILNNFRLYSLAAFTSTLYERLEDLFFITWNGEIHQVYDNVYYQIDNEQHFQSCHHLFSGGQQAVPYWINGIMDFQTEEEMVASSTFYAYGNRTATRTPISNDISFGVNQGTGGMIVLGSGDTPPKKDDYKLDSWIPTANLRMETASISLPISTLDENTTPPDRIGTFLTTFRNVTLTNITVKEIGLVIYYGRRLDGSDILSSKVLLVRDVLENPVTIKPGELYTFSLTIK